MNIALILSAIKSFISNYEMYLKYLKVILIIVLVGVAFAAVQTCRMKEKDIVNLKKVQKTRINNINDSAQEETVNVDSRSDRNKILSDSIIQRLQVELDVKDKQIISLKRINFTKQVTKTLTEYDTLFEFIEVTQTPQNFTERIDNCLTIRGSFAQDGLKLTAQRDITILDFNYKKKHRLFGIKFLEWGVKEIRQTTVTSCGDTIKQNQKLVFISSDK
tara:strand:+ start:40 stop:693 length:654 start_codon:yes stop_codon:yes gene_type:complete